MKGIAFSSLDSPNVACKDDPVSQWGLEMLMDEKEITDLLPPLSPVPVANNRGRNCIFPWITLQALPEQLSASSLPTRRLFCRPRPLC